MISFSKSLLSFGFLFLFGVLLSASPVEAAPSFHLVDITHADTEIVADGSSTQETTITICDDNQDVDTLYFMMNHPWATPNAMRAGLVKWTAEQGATEIGGDTYGNQFFELQSSSVREITTDQLSITQSPLGAADCTLYKEFTFSYTYDGFYFPQLGNIPAVLIQSRGSGQNSGWIRIPADDTTRAFDILLSTGPVQASLWDTNVSNLGNGEYQVDVTMNQPMNLEMELMETAIVSL